MKTKADILSARFVPVARVREARPYQRGRSVTPIDLFLDGNEGAHPRLTESATELLADRELIRRYPDASRLASLLAARFGITGDRVMVTAGGDEAIDRICRLALEPGRSIVIHSPTFAMIETYAALAGGELRKVDWSSGDFPADTMMAAIDDTTAVIAVVSPNNPTGLTVPAEAVRRLAEAAPHALVLVDFAYIEFADHDPTRALLSLPNVVIVRTLSKAYGLAGLRVGYALAHAAVIDCMRRAGGPYPVSSLSLALAERAMQQGDGPCEYIEEARAGRHQLARLMRDLGIDSLESQGNFLFCRTPRAQWLRQGLASLGIAVRTFRGTPGLEDAVRITVPPAQALDRLAHSLAVVLDPEAILFDMDGVLADVSASYRQAILLTAAEFGVTVTDEDVAAIKRAGNANNDWDVTVSLMSERGVTLARAEVQAVFERLYQGNGGEPGLWQHERLLCERALLTRLKQKVVLGIVTGRPRRDALRFLREHALEDLFDAIICMEDAPIKPSADPVRLALRQLGLKRAWMVGDTPDDIVAARRAGVLPIGLPAPGDAAGTGRVLRAAGTDCVLTSLSDLTELLP